MNTDAVSIKRGDIINDKNQLWQVIKTEHNFRGRGSANIIIKYKNINTGATLEKTYRSNEPLELVNIQTVQMQYLYSDDKHAFFMDERSYQQYELDKKILGNIINFFKEGEVVFVLLSDDKAVAIRPPQTVKLKVTQAQDAVKGDTATAAKKDIVVETGVNVKVPLFIKKGDVILINPDTGEYLERVNQ